MNSSKESLKLGNFQVVRFKDGTTDFVPTVWIFFDPSLGLVTKYMPPPYDENNFNTLNTLIRSRAPIEFPPVSLWPKYAVSLIGQGETFEEVEEKLKSHDPKGTRRSFMYTEESDYTPEEKSKKIEESFRQKINPDDLLKVPAFNSNESHSNVDTSWEEDTLKTFLSQKTEAVKNKKSSKKLSGRKIRKKNSKKNNKNYTSDDISSDSDHSKKNTTCLSSSNLKALNFQKHVEHDPSKSGAPHTTLTNCKRLNKEVNSPRSKSIDNKVEKLGENVSNSLSKATASVEGMKNRQLDINANVNYSSVSEDEVIQSNNVDTVQDLRKHSTKSAAASTKFAIEQSKPNEKKSSKYSSDLRSILKYLQTISEWSAELKEIRDRLSRMEIILDTLLAKNTNSKPGFIIENNINIPFKNMVEFKEFDEKLKNGAQFRFDFVVSLGSLKDTNYCVTKTITNILKKYLVKDLALKFTNTKKSGDKEILKSFEFHRCLTEAVISTHYDIKTKNCVSDKEVLEAIGIVLSNVKDWEGGRKERTQRRKS